MARVPSTLPEKEPSTRDIELARADVLWDIAVKTAVEAPCPEAIDAATRVLQLRSRLLGLD